MKPCKAISVAVTAIAAMALSGPSAFADGESNCTINNHGNNSGANACRDVVVGTGHNTGTSQAAPQARLVTQRVESPPVRLIPGATASLSLPCPVGTLLLGGGWKITPESGTPTPVILESHPDDDDTRWLVVAQNTGTNAFSIQVINQCTV